METKPRPRMSKENRLRMISALALPNGKFKLRDFYNFKPECPKCGNQAKVCRDSEGKVLATMQIGLGIRYEVFIYECTICKHRFPQNLRKMEIINDYNLDEERSQR